MKEEKEIEMRERIWGKTAKIKGHLRGDMKT